MTLHFHVAVLSFPVMMFVCVYVFICRGMALILTRPFMLGGLPFLTYAVASLSPASPSVRGLHPKKLPHGLLSSLSPI